MHCEIHPQLLLRILWVNLIWARASYDFDFELTPKVKTSNCSTSTIRSVIVRQWAFQAFLEKDDYIIELHVHDSFLSCSTYSSDVLSSFCEIRLFQTSYVGSVLECYVLVQNRMKILQCVICKLLKYTCIRSWPFTNYVYKRRGVDKDYSEKTWQIFSSA